jgi:hypothetical protein
VPWGGTEAEALQSDLLPERIVPSSWTEPQPRACSRAHACAGAPADVEALRAEAERRDVVKVDISTAPAKQTAR